MMNCSKCGNEPQETDIFGWKCTSCGKVYGVKLTNLKTINERKNSGNLPLMKCKECGESLDNGNEKIIWKCSCGNAQIGKLEDYVEKISKVAKSNLIKCPECGREKVSSRAEVCPDCGYGIKAHFEEIKKQDYMRTISVQKQNNEDINRKNYEKKHMTVQRPKKPAFNKVFKGYLIVSIILITLLFLIDIIYQYFITKDTFYIFSAIIFYIPTIALFTIVPLGIYYDMFRKKVDEYKLSQQNFKVYQKYIIWKQEQKTRRNSLYTFYVSNNQVRCPRCGSINLQIVQRKWSFLTGLMTNKVDRICVNCMNRF